MENLKYELIEAEANRRGIKYRARALKDFGNVKKGDISGLINEENSISQEGNCWVFPNAEIHDKARIYDNAQMHDNTKIYDRAKMFDNTMMHDNAEMHDLTSLHNNAEMHGEAKMRCRAKMRDDAKMFDDTMMFGNSIMMDDAKMHDDAGMYDDAEMRGHSEMHGHTVIMGTHILGDEILRYPKLYEYTSMPILDGSDKVREIKMGCTTRTIEEWRNDFRNNIEEFPIGSDAEAKRLNAINYVLMTLGEDQIQL